MKVLWFTNTMMPALSRALNRSPEVIGGWMPSLLDALRRIPGIELAVATAASPHHAIERLVVDEVTYYCLPRSGGQRRLTPELARACRDVVRTFGPEVIHVHGTEDVYAQFTASPECTCPAVVSIQGLIHEYSRHVDGGLRLDDVLGAGASGLLSWIRFRLQQREWTIRGRAEQQAIRANGDFIGRTAWDEAHVRALNPAARYHRCDEVLRPAFFSARWELGSVRRHSLFCTAAHSPLKGFHVLLAAVAMLRREFPQVQVRVAGAPWNTDRGVGYYGRYIKALIDAQDLGRHVTPLPVLDAEGVVAELRTAHAFVMPSLIENSPNSLAEAMLVGTPSAAALVGGIPSMVEDGETAVCFPSGDAACVAHAIRRVFSDDALALRLSSQARSVALARHDPALVAAAQLRVYREVVAQRTQAEAM